MLLYYNRKWNCILYIIIYLITALIINDMKKNEATDGSSQEGRMAYTHRDLKFATGFVGIHILAAGISASVGNAI